MSRMPVRALVLAAALAGAACAPARVPPEPACRPRVNAPEPTPPAPPPVSITTAQPVRVCVLRGGGLEEVVIGYDVLTGDSTYQGRPFSEAFPADSPYAASARWFIDGEMLPWRGRRLAKYGLPRVIEGEYLERVGEHRGVPLFAEEGLDEEAGGGWVLYVPVQPGCVFQVYLIDYHSSAVRGD
ncbi:MAG TPA: hypothetical protein VFQ45_22885 [Longimicrobium sp.]|nr:hypothetical protein [Longimicrobium sp.]